MTDQKLRFVVGVWDDDVFQWYHWYYDTYQDADQALCTLGPMGGTVVAMDSYDDVVTDY